MASIKPDVTVTHSPEETELLGINFGKQLPDRSVVCFFGDLGAGKTTFIKGLVNGVANIDPESVNSPTFVYLNIYEGKSPVYHFDLYRLENAQAFLAMGFDEYVGEQGVCCIEWSEKIEELLPPHVIRVELTHIDRLQREVCIIR